MPSMPSISSDVLPSNSNTVSEKDIGIAKECDAIMNRFLTIAKDGLRVCILRDSVFRPMAIEQNQNWNEKEEPEVLDYLENLYQRHFKKFIKTDNVPLEIRCQIYVMTSMPVSPSDKKLLPANTRFDRKHRIVYLEWNNLKFEGSHNPQKKLQNKKQRKSRDSKIKEENAEKIATIENVHPYLMQMNTIDLTISNLVESSGPEIRKCLASVSTQPAPEDSATTTAFTQSCDSVFADEHTRNGTISKKIFLLNLLSLLNHLGKDLWDKKLIDKLEAKIAGSNGQQALARENVNGFIKEILTKIFDQIRDVNEVEGRFFSATMGLILLNNVITTFPTSVETTLMDSLRVHTQATLFVFVPAPTSIVEGALRKLLNQV